MEAEEDFDTHICLRCRTTIVGLDEYINHRKHGCPAAVPVKFKSNPNEMDDPRTVVGVAMRNRQLDESPQQQVPSGHDGVPSDLSIPADQLQQDAFLTLLELQSKSSPVKAMTPISPRNPPSENAEPGVVGGLPLQEIEFRTNEEHGYDYILEALADDSDDEMRNTPPPKTHTGGKWLPGKRKIDREYQQAFTNNSENGDNNENECDTNDKVGNGQYCDVCDKILLTKHAYNKHFNSPYHLRKVNGGSVKVIDCGNEDDGVNQYNCKVCCRRLSTKFAYLRHVNSAYHLNRAHRDFIESIAKNDEFSDAAASPSVVRKSVRRVFKSRLLSDKMWKLNDEVDVKEKHTGDKEDDDDDNNDNELESSSNVLVCPPCKRTFQSKRNFAQHLLTTFHMKRTENDPERLQLIFKHLDLLTKFSPFQCGICSYYFNHNHHFLDHWNSSGHLENVGSMVGPFLCVECEFSCETNKEMMLHLIGDEHAELITTLDRKHPIIIKEKRSDLSCKDCGSKFASAYALRKHERSSTHQRRNLEKDDLTNGGKPSLECADCGWVATNQSSLDIHRRRRHTNEKPFRCIPCKKAFADAGSLAVHRITLTHKRIVGELPVRPIEPKTKEVSAEVRKCPLCGVELVGELELKDHSCPKMQEVIVDTIEDRDQCEMFSCTKCPYICNSSAQFVFHQTLHQLPQVTPVSGREKSAKPEEEVPEVTISDIEKGVSGDNCSMVDADGIEMVTSTSSKCRGVESVQSIPLGRGNSKVRTVKKYKCSYCGKLFPKPTLLCHLHTHTGEKPYKCNECDAAFAQRGTLYMHLRRHSGVKQFKCDRCSFTAEKPSRLKRHQETHNADRPRPHLCEVCGSGYHDRWELRHHMKVHFGKDHKCTYDGCTQAFRCPSELQMHIRVHTDERPFLCDECGYRSRSQHQLTKHRRSHTGERPFKCSFCSYSAHLSPHLLRHMRIHTGSKPYKCPYCDYTCNTQENVRKHILKTKKHEGKKMYPCPFCDYATNSAAEYKTHVLDNHHELVSPEQTDVISLLAGVYDRRNDCKVNDSTSIIPYVPRQERLSKNKLANAGEELKKKRNSSNGLSKLKENSKHFHRRNDQEVRVEHISTMTSTSEPTVYAIQVASNTFDIMEAAAEQILQSFDGNGNADSIFLPVQHHQGSDVVVDECVVVGGGDDDGSHVGSNGEIYIPNISNAIEESEGTDETIETDGAVEMDAGLMETDDGQSTILIYVPMD